MPRAFLTSFQSYKSSQALLLFHCFSDIDECATGTHNCSDHAVCYNTKGGHNCTCKKGFIGDGENCTGEILPYQHVFLATFQLAPNLQVVSSLVPFKTISTERSSNKWKNKITKKITHSMVTF